MSRLGILRELSGADLRSVQRDSMLRGMLIVIFVLAGLTRFIVQWITVKFELDLEPHYPLIMSALVVFLAPVLLGYVIGILLLDERDEGTLQAMRVTPLPMWQYLAWKLTLPVLVTCVLTPLMFPIVGLMRFRLSYLAPIVIGALWAPLLALAMSCFARNKLQGFVLMRISNVLLVIPMIAWFFPRWEPFVMVFPAYWPLKTFWLAAEGQSDLWCVVLGFVIHVAVIAWLYRHFQTVLGRAA